MSLLLTGIGELSTLDDTLDGAHHTDGLGVLHDAALVVDDDATIAWLGPASHAPAADRRIDLDGGAVVPAFVDSHTHLVFAGDRGPEFAARMTGTAYDGGGIATTVAATRAATDDELRGLLRSRVGEMRAQGTGVVEIKSGYGLNVEAETRLLRLAAEVTDEVTFLGAHVVPPSYRERPAQRDDYLALVTGPMLAAAREHARWIDVFCEPHSPHAFTADEARVVLEAGRAAGLGLRVHGNQVGPGPGVRLAVELGAASVDHCTHLTDADVDALAAGADTTVATLLPGVEFSTRSPYPDARRLFDAGVTIALATDCNPGTCYSSSMPFVIALAVREMGMTPAEALRAATLGAARSLRRPDLGRLVVGGAALLTTLDAPSYLHLAYRPGVPLARLLDLETTGAPARPSTPHLTSRLSPHLSLDAMLGPAPVDITHVKGPTMTQDRLGLVRFSERPPTQWRNGHGSTREMAKRLLGGTGPDFVWRLSIAEVTEDSEFSSFPGVDRSATLIWGDGLTLEVDGSEQVMTPFEPFRFPGQARTFARPIGGPVRILNVMTKVNRMSAGITVLDLDDGKPVSIAGATCLVQLTGGSTAHAGDGASAELLPLDILTPRPRVRLIAGTGLVAVVRMENYRAYRD